MVQYGLLLDFKVKVKDVKLEIIVDAALLRRSKVVSAEDKLKQPSMSEVAATQGETYLLKGFGHENRKIQDVMLDKKIMID